MSCEKDNGSNCGYPEVFTDTDLPNRSVTGNDCRCRTDNGYRVMGRNGELCVPYFKIMEIHEQRLGGVGVSFVHLERSIPMLRTDTLFFGALFIETDVPDSLTTGFSVLFGEVGYHHPSVQRWLNTCYDSVGVSNTLVGSNIDDGGLVSIDPEPGPFVSELPSGTKIEIAWMGVDTDEDCIQEWIRARFQLEPDGSGQGHLFVFDHANGESGDRILTDSIGITLEPIPTSW